MPLMPEEKPPAPKPPPPRVAGCLRRTCALFVLLVAVPMTHAGVPSLSEGMNLDQANPRELSDLSLSNFFSDGWSERWSKRPRGDGTPDMSLLRVQTNFLVQLFRLDTYVETNVHSAKTQSIEYLNGTVEYAVSRRLMFALFSKLEQHDSRAGPDEHGFGGGFFGRVQLVDRAASSEALTLKVAAPDTWLDEHQTTLSYTLSGWQDLRPVGLKKTGLYFHAQHEILVGPHAAGAKQNDVTYDISLAKTWTSPDSAIENLTTFVEAFGKTDLDGAKAGSTAVSITPGFRFNFRQKQILMFGVDLPVSHPPHYDNIFRLTYIANF
jgi:hypothetical protein